MRDADGFDEFYRATALPMLRYAYALTGDRADAQDLVQEAYARAWRHWRTVAEHPAPTAWVRLVVARLATDQWRRMRGLRAAVVRSGRPQPSPAPTEDTVLLVSALRRLPARQRQAMALHYLLGLTIDEIATEMGVASGTVKSWLARGRARLADLLTDPAAPRPAEVRDGG